MAPHFVASMLPYKLCCWACHFYFKWSVENRSPAISQNDVSIRLDTAPDRRDDVGQLVPSKFEKGGCTDSRTVKTANVIHLELKGNGEI